MKRSTFYKLFWSVVLIFLWAISTVAAFSLARSTVVTSPPAVHSQYTPVQDPKKECDPVALAEEFVTYKGTPFIFLFADSDCDGLCDAVIVAMVTGFTNTGEPLVNVVAILTCEEGKFYLNQMRSEPAPGSYQAAPISSDIAPRVIKVVDVVSNGVVYEFRYIDLNGDQVADKCDVCRFAGVSNGQRVYEHNGSFFPWQCDQMISKYNYVIKKRGI